MVQTGFRKTIEGQAWENYESMHKALRHQYGDRVLEHYLHYKQTSPTSATAVEFAEKGGLTISDKGKTAVTLVLACDTNDNAYDTKTVTIHYKTNAGTAKTAVATYDPDNTTTEVAFSPVCNDFYCWNLDDYTPATVIVSSVAVQAGDNVYIGTTGMVAGAELRYATIAAAATYPVASTLYSVGNIFGAEEANTAGDVGKVITLEYYTPWGSLKEANITLAANTTTIQRFMDTTNVTYPVLDFYRIRDLETTGAVGKYVCIAVDADKQAGTTALDTYYGVIEEGNYESVHSRVFVPAASVSTKYMGDIHCAQTSKDYPVIVELYFQSVGCATQEKLIWSYTAGTDINLTFPFELEPLSEIMIKIADDGSHPVDCSLTIRWLEVQVEA